MILMIDLLIINRSFILQMVLLLCILLLNSSYFDSSLKRCIRIANLWTNEPIKELRAMIKHLFAEYRFIIFNSACFLWVHIKNEIN